MGVPVIQVNESNTSAQTVTANIGSIAFASVDQNSNVAGLATNNPILVGNNSFEKWLRAAVVTAATNSLSNFTVQFSATAPTDANASSTNLTFKFGVNAAYATPVATTSIVATTTCVGTAATAFTPPANTVGALSGYITQQLQSGAGAAGGNCIFPTPWMTISYIYS